MAFIKYVPPADVPSEFQVDDNDNILQIHSVHPEVLKLHYDLYIQLMHKPGVLTRVQRELIGTVVSAINECHYWTEHHGRGLRLELIKSGWTNEAAIALVEILKTARDESVLENVSLTEVNLADVDSAILRYAIKLTLTPGKINSADVELLKALGLDDVAIHDIAAITGYFAFVNRIADGLGVQLEERF